ncbi:MAG: iron-sulfur cluster repair protein YtfE [Bauldia sp.]|nr:iron-sulfur cluster repair protein YtfE [Bauldia sp.]
MPSALEPPASRFIDRTVGDVAAQLAGATAVFRRHKIDFCCGGGVSLAEAAAKRGVDAAAVAAELAALDATPPDAPQETAALVDHIVVRYHETHRRELPELVRLARRVEAVHREHPEAPAGLADLLSSAQDELRDHMAKEEQVLFPAMREGYARSLDMPIFAMRHDHDHHAETIRALQSITHGYTLPAGACRSWQALYNGVEKLVTDLTEHIHLENNVLFPRFERGRNA